PDKIALIGNPNVGKSVIFGVLTGKYANVSNYPGTTVEVTRGEGKINKRNVQIIDTPGTNSLIPLSEDERVTRDIILNEPIKSILQVGDGKNLKRTLMLSLQLAEMGVPFVLNLNMMDETKQAGITIDNEKLSGILKVKVNGTVAVRKVGTSKIDKLLAEATKSDFTIKYSEKVENAITKISTLLNDSPVEKRAMALMLMVQDKSLMKWVDDNLDEPSVTLLNEIILDLERNLNNPINVVITQTRYKHVEKIFNKVVSRKKNQLNSVNLWLDKYVTHPIWGMPFLAIILFIMYEFVGVFGAGTAVDFFENTLFGGFINPAAIWLFNTFIPIEIVRELFVGQYGIITMALAYGFAIVLPIVTTFFIVFSILEDSGYLPRLALLVNRFFNILGLNGKAVLPMVLGLGCDTMATMSARILETRKERILITLLLALGVPCSAQLGVILGMTAMLSLKATLLWVTVVSGVMVLVGYLSSRILPGKQSDFILELPPLRLPVFSNILIKTFARIEWYLKEIIPIFILGTLILFVLDKTQLILWIEQISEPVVQNLLGLPAKATEAFLIGFLRRDYGAAGLFNLANQGLLDANQIVVSVVTITLFMPCIANLLMIIKELGWKVALAMSLFIVPFAFVVGGIINHSLKLFGIVL
ncbi:MAG: ferrous iron transport protein B, partial [Calditrichia bacterium]|nr:ferrous iron transport protein B [Calditrichia bacterium]